MDTHLDSKLQEYYQRFIELQDKLRKSEEERLQLEMKFQDVLQMSREEEQSHYRKLRAQYKKFLEEDKRRHDRNDWIITTLERIDTRIADLHAKTERINWLRQQCVPVTKLPYNRKENQQNDNGIDIQTTDINSPFFKRNLVYNDKTSGISQPYRNNDKVKSLEKFISKDSNTREATTPDKLVLGELEKAFSANQANYIADEIMRSIHSRYYVQNPVYEKSDTSNVRLNINNVVQQNNRSAITPRDSQTSRLVPKQVNSAYMKRINNNNTPATSPRYSSPKVQRDQPPQIGVQNLDENKISTNNSVNANLINSNKIDFNQPPEIKERTLNTVVKKPGKSEVVPEQSKMNQQNKKINKDLELIKKENAGNGVLKKESEINNLSIKKADRSRAPTPTKLKPISKSPVNDTSPKKPVVRKFKKLVSGIIKNKKPTIPGGSTKKENSQENTPKEKQLKQNDTKKVEQKESLENKQEKKRPPTESRRPSPVNYVEDESVDKPLQKQQANSSPRQQAGVPQQILNDVQPNISNGVDTTGSAYQNLSTEFDNNHYYPMQTESYGNIQKESLENDSLKVSQEYYVSENPQQSSYLESSQIYDGNSISASNQPDANLFQNNMPAQESGLSVPDEYDSNTIHNDSNQQGSTSPYYEQYSGQYVHNNLEVSHTNSNVAANQYANEPAEDTYNNMQFPEASDRAEQPTLYDMQSHQQYVDTPVSDQSGQPVVYDLPNNQQYMEVPQDGSSQSVMYNQQYSTEDGSIQYNEQEQYNEGYSQEGCQQYYDNYSQEYMQQYATDPNYDGQYAVPNQECGQLYAEQTYDNNSYQTSYNPQEEQSLQQNEVIGPISDPRQGQSVNSYEYYNDTNDTESNKADTTNLESNVGNRQPENGESLAERGNNDSKMQPSVLEMLDTDTESLKKNISKASNDSDSDFITN